MTNRYCNNNNTVIHDDELSYELSYCLVDDVGRIWVYVAER